MPEAVSALKGVSHTGFATVAEAGLTGMIQIRADLASPRLAAVLAERGLAVPAQRKVVTGGGRSLAWMSPDELLLFCSYDEARVLAGDLTAEMGGEHALIVNVSDMRAVFIITGAKRDEVLMKLCPVDFATLPEMELRRTRAAQTGVALWRSGPEEITLICFRSVAGYMMGLLETASRKGGEIF
ncbi:sarcosine oxidase subunit gamma [Paenirhodobacter populi]|uniref:Sarcosine oxidase subunit gamma n=1 Tax=Paenirhodobacter populi TaxID=2306993 RepID=A0A443IXZ2_9RHOB|nr:sarcosine oxidase subunit gamma family protein [Sinirhodobacter populi]RWR13048.1 sarcosine oxidase subunit gamma [Sinirhodobacter populi]